MKMAAVGEERRGNSLTNKIETRWEKVTDLQGKT
jgi:hypothetical protein